MKTSLLLLTCMLIPAITTFAQDTVAINTAVQYQTIEGWGHGGGVLGHTGAAYSLLDSSVANPMNYQLLDFLVDELGLTGSRTWEVGPRVDGAGMDNGDCDSLDLSKFQVTLPPTEGAYLSYFKNRILAQGIQPSFYSSPGYPTHATDQKPWVVYHPGERAQQLWASALYMKNTYGININEAVIYNEPQGIITAAILADDIKASAPRFALKGLATKCQFPEAVTPQTAWNFITPVQNDTDMWAGIGRISYHNYGTADPYRDNIKNLGLSLGIRTAQTEMGNPNFDDLYHDLTLGGVSYWEVGYSANVTLVPNSGLTSFTPSSYYMRLRQVLHYVRPGAVRVAATPSDTLLSVLAFTRGGQVTTVIDNKNAAAKTVFLTGLPAGTYGLSKAASGATIFSEAGVQTVGAGGTLTVTAPGGSSITTLYPRSAVNQPPTIMTWSTNPGYIVSPVAAATLTVAASDPELNPLTYQWTSFSHPAGANPVIASPAAATTGVTGMTIPGNYVFQISVSDGVAVSTKKIYLEVYPANPPPVLGSAGFRINTPYGLVFGNPGDTTHANIELPTTAATLQVGISDLANTDFTGRGTWSLVSQPAGANAVVGATTYIFVSIRANVTGMTVPGDYVFRCNVTNGSSPDLTARIICTVHPASQPPVIASVTANPSGPTLPVSAALLSAVTSDPENDLLRHWWVIKTAPAGARPVFDHQGRAVSNVSGLTVPGNYVFTLRCFDDLHMVTKDVSLTVHPDPNPSDVGHTGADGLLIYPNPVSDVLTVAWPDQHTEVILNLANAVGQPVQHQVILPAYSRKWVMDLKALSPGIYFLTIKQGGNRVVRKIVKDQ